MEFRMGWKRSGWWLWLTKQLSKFLKPFQCANTLMVEFLRRRRGICRGKRRQHGQMASVLSATQAAATPLWWILIASAKRQPAPASWRRGAGAHWTLRLHQYGCCEHPDQEA